MAEQAQVAGLIHPVHIGVAIADLGTRVELMLASVETPGMRETARYYSVAFERPPAPDELVERVVRLALNPEVASIAGVGVAVWGRVSSARGEVADARFGAEWAGYPLVARLTEALGAPVRVTTGVRAAAQAEALTGAGKGRSPLLYIHLGRSVSSALVIAGEPLVGAHDDEGRLGHWQTGLESPRCACGAYGHLEPLVSAQSLVRLAIGVAANDDDALAAIYRVTGGRAESLTARQLVTLASEGMPPLRELMDYAVDALSGAMANLVVALDPAMIVIGGPLAQADEVFFVWLRERLAARLASAGASPELAPAGCGSRGAVTGAMALAAKSGAQD